MHYVNEIQSGKQPETVSEGGKSNKQEESYRMQ